MIHYIVPYWNTGMQELFLLLNVSDIFLQLDLLVSLWCIHVVNMWTYHNMEAKKPSPHEVDTVTKIYAVILLNDMILYKKILGLPAKISDK